MKTSSLKNIWIHRLNSDYTCLSVCLSIYLSIYLFPVLHKLALTIELLKKKKKNKRWKRMTGGERNDDNFDNYVDKED